MTLISFGPRDVNAMRLPSGDQAGWIALRASGVSRWSFPPSLFRMRIWTSSKSRT
jgi:hypothetical protein